MPGPFASQGTIPASTDSKVLEQIKGGGITLAQPTLDTPFGPLVVTMAIRQKWESLRSQHEAGGQNVQAYLGWPLRRLDFGGGTAVYFERGMIVDRGAGGAFVVYGAIYLRYASFGDVQPTGWSPGLPISDEEAVPNGRRSRFDGADIYWSGASDAHEVHGGIRAHWEQLGGVSGFLGYPLSDETSVRNGGAEIGRMNLFQGGSIYWSPNTGAWEVHGDLRKAWLERFGGPTGPLGWPTSDESSSPSGGLRYNDFQHGVLAWPGNYAGIRMLTGADVYVDRFDSKGSHTTAESLGLAGVWLYVNTSVVTNTSGNAGQRFPGSDHYGANASPHATLMTINPLRGETTIDITLDGWDAVAIGSDAHLGTIHDHFDLDRIFNNPGPQEPWNGDFFAAYSVRDLTPANPMDPSFRQDLFWGFGNFTTAQLSRQLFGQTFTDVQGDESGWHPFDDLFYDNVYKGIAAGGNCFGMCLEANDALNRHSLFSESIHSVPGNGVAMQEMNIKQAYQIGAGVIDYVAGKFLTGGTHDPVRCFRESRDMYARNDFPIISLTNAFIGGSGHAVRPYRWDDSNPNDWVIFVANPNEPAPSGSDADGQNTIHIDPHANRFTFAFGGPSDVWTGDAWTGGRMFALPYSVMCEEPRTPFWETLLALIGGSILILAGDAQTEQITDGAGRSFYQSGLNGAPTRWDQINNNAASQIPGLARLPLHHQKPFEHLNPEVLKQTVEGIGGAAAGGQQAGAGGGSAASGAIGKLHVDPSQIGVIIGALQPAVPELYRLQGIRPFGPSPAEAPLAGIGTVGSTVHLGTALGATSVGVSAVPAESPAAGALASGEIASAALTAKEISIAAAGSVASGVMAGAGAVTTAVGPVEQLVHSVAPRSGSYTWAVHSAGASAAATVPGGAQAADSFAVSKPGAVDQSLAVTLAPAAAPRAVDMTLVSSVARGTQELRTFRLRGVALEAGKEFTAALTPDGGQIVLQNAGQPVTLQLEIQAGLGAGAMVSRPSVTLDAGKAATIQPDSWDPAQIATSPVTMTVLDKIGGTVIEQMKLQ